jgi:hypothetical protein
MMKEDVDGAKIHHFPVLSAVLKFGSVARQKRASLLPQPACCFICFGTHTPGVAVEN